MTLIIILGTIYLAIVGFLGYVGYKKTKNNNDYLIGGRQIPSAIMALSYGATFISTSAIIGYGGASAVNGMSLIWLTFLTIFVGVFIAFVFFGKKTLVLGKSLDAKTFSELLGKRYNSTFIKKFVGISIFIFMPIYCASVIIGASKFIENTIGVDYLTSLLTFTLIVSAYVFFGGLKGVMYSDALQAVLMLVGMLFLGVWTYAKLGGIGEAHNSLTNLMNSATVIEQTKNLSASGFNGFTNMPKLFSDTWWTIISSTIMGVGIGVLAQPQLIVRFMTVKNPKEINRAIPVGGIFILVMTGVAFTVGALSNVIFFDKYGKISVLVAGGTDNIVPLYIKEFLPGWFTSIFLIIIVAAAMSTLSSQFHTLGTAVGYDMVNQENKSEKKLMIYTKGGTLIGMLITLILAIILPNVWDGAISISTSLFFGLFCSSFLTMYAGGLYSKKLSKKAAISGMLTGFISSLLWMIFIHAKEAIPLNICNLLFNKPVLFEGTIKNIDPLFIGLPLCIIVTITVQVVSLLKGKNSNEIAVVS